MVVGTASLAYPMLIERPFMLSLSWMFCTVIGDSKGGVIGLI
jgi:hypothetical protein